MSVLSMAAPIQAIPTTSSRQQQQQQQQSSLSALEEEKKHAAQLVKALAERYGERAIQRWSTEPEASDVSSTSTSSSSSSSAIANPASIALGTSPSASSTYKPFSSTWAARYWQLQKVKAEQMLAELDRAARDKSLAQESASRETEEQQA